MPFANDSGLQENDSLNCDYEPMEFLDGKIYVVGLFGTVIAVVGIALNVLCAWILGKMAFGGANALIYLFTLAILDVFFLCFYILIFSVQIYFDFFESFALYLAWNNYIIPVYTLSKMVQTASTYLIVSASVERFLDVGGCFGKVVINCGLARRVSVVLCVLAFAFLFRLVSYFEIDVEVFVPFFLLLILNTGIFYQIRKALRQSNIDHFLRNSVWRGEKQKDSLKVATKMLVAIVASYLLSNLLSVCITFIEHANMDFLQDNNQFYTFAVDTINLLYVITASTRLLIYGACNFKIRSEVVRILSRSSEPSSPHREHATNNDRKHDNNNDNGAALASILAVEGGHRRTDSVESLLLFERSSNARTEIDSKLSQYGRALINGYATTV